MFGGSGSRDRSPADPRLVAFLRARLVEELGLLWERDERRRRRAGGPTPPGLAAQVQVIDEVLVRLEEGRLPDPVVLRLLLHAYRSHPDHEPRWSGQPAAG